ncbi:hypothetical protein [Streptomyces sp. NPDC088249]|uniref:hypothetical protein n=1 Tax=Streptomyces sp. NPDC088249 TaxID=3365843 RepID=UPI003818058C
MSGPLRNSATFKPCPIRGAGREGAAERPVATIDQVFALAEAIGIRWRLVVLLGAFASMRPEELAELRRAGIDLDADSVRVRWAPPELNTGRRVIGDPKSRADKQEIMSPASCSSMFVGTRSDSPSPDLTVSCSRGRKVPLCAAPTR